ncbi:STAS domain-containing protein [Streptomyces glaucescens]|uniref:Putative ANTAR domain protein n=1 Tax=Streptomyces glaucescens TaxID=1907 RepID=A0A089XJ53_STRGA|nr:STAS domain-containing protein [Streptomyces glaucescens]AIS01977.1 putative ANTAR domain protein [Streptomyces glaucescens]
MPESEDHPPSAVGSLGPTVRTRPDGGRARVTVSGELGLEAGEDLRAALRTALAGTDDGIDLDLSEVAFCDCSSLNILLALREQALGEGKSVTLRAVSPAVERLLTLTGTLPLFAPAAAERTGDRPESGLEVVQLRRAMRTRPTIDLARGVLMASFGLSPQDAWEVLVAVSQHTNTKLHRLADGLVAAVQGDPLAEPLRREVAAAVARVRAAGEKRPG